VLKDDVKGVEVGGACSMYEGEMKNSYKNLVGTLKRNTSKTEEKMGG
jgi:hypothetical protein